MYASLAALLLSLALPAGALVATGDPTRVSKRGDTMTGTLNAYAVGNATYSVVVASGVRLSTAGLTFADGTLQYTAAAGVDLSAIGASTAALAASTGALSLSTVSLQVQIDALAVSTGSLFDTRASSGINADLTQLKTVALMDAAVTMKSSSSVEGAGSYSGFLAQGCRLTQSFELSIGPDCTTGSSFTGGLTATRWVSTQTASTGHYMEWRVGFYNANTNIVRFVGTTRGGSGTHIVGIDFKTGGTDSSGALVLCAGLFACPEGARLDSSENFGIGTGSTISDKLHVVGAIRATTYVNTGDGSDAAPAYTFVADPNTGLYRSATDTTAVSAGGSRMAQFGPSAVELGAAATPSTFTAAGYWIPRSFTLSVLCTTPGVSKAVVEDETNFDLWTGTGTAAGSWKNTRTGAGPC